jgi:hypothetical protein
LESAVTIPVAGWSVVSVNVPGAKRLPVDADAEELKYANVANVATVASSDTNTRLNKSLFLLFFIPGSLHKE